MNQTFKIEVLYSTGDREEYEITCISLATLTFLLLSLEASPTVKKARKL